MDTAAEEGEEKRSRKSENCSVLKKLDGPLYA